jgi:membrane protein DedA with SNARE-associated domain
MVGTTIGMVISYWIGSLFRERLHVKFLILSTCI